MSKSTISIFELFDLFPDEDEHAGYFESLLQNCETVTAFAEISVEESGV